ncbi:tRNA pseudouridine(54/55) synthase Pus10 [Candidatus Bipolaricaulota bacterium]|nr:tRNA pseudouridine(54/55) synthase Pus10 [Candidatus Bipolaricaulota bacterium]
MDLREKRNALLELDLCDRCLGRQFAMLGHGLENYERGAIARTVENLKEDSFVDRNVPETDPTGEECPLCCGLFENLEEYVDQVIRALEPYEIRTLLLGTRLPEEIERAEEKIWEDFGKKNAEPTKTELNRLVGRKVQTRLGVEADFKRPDVNAILDLRDDRVELQVNSSFFHAKYNKYVRGIPQTVWYCKECGGRGCAKCDYTGKKYQESVQEIIQERFLKSADAKEATFHGAGREDVDARCFGRREFVLELHDPRKRSLALEDIQEKLNRSQAKVELFGVKETSKDKVKEIKEKKADKTYRAVVRLSGDISEARMDKISEVQGTIDQRTPKRVVHRRADLVRERKVYWIHAEELCRGVLDITIKAEAGTYIKELISGDDGRTKPSVAGQLGCMARCEKLDVLDID